MTRQAGGHMGDGEATGHERRGSVPPPLGASCRAYARAPVLVAALALWSAVGCGPEGLERGAERRARETGFRGVLLPEPLARPDFTLTDTSGRSFHFREETEGRLALLFFGYTHCPDVCPVHMANLAAVLDDLPYEARAEVRVVFVTTDPERDTPERLRAWLDRFDPAFVGLRGAPSEVNRIQAALDLPPAVRQPAEGEEYAVGHASQVIAFGAGGSTVAYPFGTRQADWAHDLPKLVGRLDGS